MNKHKSSFRVVTRLLFLQCVCSKYSCLLERRVCLLDVLLFIIACLLEVEGLLFSIACLLEVFLFTIACLLEVLLLQRVCSSSKFSCIASAADRVRLGCAHFRKNSSRSVKQSYANKASVGEGATPSTMLRPPMSVYGRTQHRGRRFGQWAMAHHPRMIRSGPLNESFVDDAEGIVA